MVRRVAAQDAASGESFCRSGFSRELLLWPLPESSRLPPLLQERIWAAAAQAAVIDVFTQLRPFALAAYRARSAISSEESMLSIETGGMVSPATLSEMRMLCLCVMQGLSL